MKFLVSGSTGMVGSALVPFLTSGGHSVTRLVRSAAGKNEARWDPAGGAIDAAALEGHEAVVHLAGENIAGRWSPEKKARIRDSRVKGTRLLAEALGRLAQPPKVLVAASAIGYYGDRGDALLREDSVSGSGFLAEVAREWEGATAPATARGIRVVNLRIGVVLSRRGGALAKMLLPFKLGAGGVVGSGKQHWSWVALDDLVEIIFFAATTDSLKGPVNAVSPKPVTNYKFTKLLGRVLRRPTIFPMPAFAARLVLGEMADELLLASTKVEPAKLVAAGYPFRFPELDGALRHALKR
ncbi:MAG: TIGR01777 family oxidoreductase [Candidatus Acidiferrales bacterium]